MKWKTQKIREFFFSKKKNISTDIEFMLDNIFALAQNDVQLSEEDVQRFLESTERLQELVDSEMRTLREQIRSKLTN